VQGDPIVVFRGNTQQLYSYIIGICMYVHNNEKGTHYCVTMATLVTRNGQIITLY